MPRESATLDTARMTVDAFLVWALDRSGRYELVDGEVVAMSPERVLHAEVKAAAYLALRDAIQRAAVPCRAMPDGMTVRINTHTAYEPDALVYCGPRLSSDAVEVTEPLIIVEALSPSTKSVDTGAKLIGYFTVPSLQHYLIVDGERRVLVHHARAEGGAILTRIVTDGVLRLDPPGLDVPVDAMFAEP